MIQVLPSLPTVVGYLIDLADDFAQIRSGTQVILTIDEDLSLHLLPDLHGGQTLLSLYRPGDQGTGLHFNPHEFQHIQSLEGTPTAIELQKILSHLRNRCFQAGCRSILRQLPVEVSKTMF